MNIETLDMNRSRFYQPPWAWRNGEVFYMSPIYYSPDTRVGMATTFGVSLRENTNLQVREYNTAHGTGQFTFDMDKVSGKIIDYNIKTAHTRNTTSISQMHIRPCLVLTEDDSMQSGRGGISFYQFESGLADKSTVFRQVIASFTGDISEPSKSTCHLPLSEGPFSLPELSKGGIFDFTGDSIVGIEEGSNRYVNFYDRFDPEKPSLKRFGQHLVSACVHEGTAGPILSISLLQRILVNPEMRILNSDRFYRLIQQLPPPGDGSPQDFAKWWAVIQSNHLEIFQQLQQVMVMHLDRQYIMHEITFPWPIYNDHYYPVVDVDQMVVKAEHSPAEIAATLESAGYSHRLREADPEEVKIIKRYTGGL